MSNNIDINLKWNRVIVKLKSEIKTNLSEDQILELSKLFKQIWCYGWDIVLQSLIWKVSDLFKIMLNIVVYLF